MLHKSHYDTLGVSRTASKDEIKAAFRKLSMETHPDVASGQAERFKIISEAYRVLSNEKERRLYDLEVEEASRFGGAFRRRAQDPGFGGQRPGLRAAANEGLHGVLDIVFRPRNLFLGLTIGFLGLIFVRPYLRQDSEREKLKKHKGKAMVEAWKNPATGKWELPAPYDPTYRKLRPPLHFVPREQVERGL